MLTTCTTSQKVFVVGFAGNTPGQYSNTQSDSPGEACQKFMTLFPGSASLADATQFTCKSTLETIAYPIIKLCEPSPPYRATTEEYQAVSSIFVAILVASCMIYGAKKIYNLLTNRPEA